MDQIRPSEREALLAEVDGAARYQGRYRWVMLSLLWLLYAAFGLV